MCKGATKLPNGLLELDPSQNTLGWFIFLAIGIGSAALMLFYHVWLKRQIAKEQGG
jgi:hypothetical protein